MLKGVQKPWPKGNTRPNLAVVHSKAQTPHSVMSVRAANAEVERLPHNFVPRIGTDGPTVEQGTFGIIPSGKMGLLR
jgi:hypothetical protein